MVQDNLNWFESVSKLSKVFLSFNLVIWENYFKPINNKPNKKYLKKIEQSNVLFLKHG